jgi:hypothetical protein
MKPLDYPALKVAAIAVWRLRSLLGWRHWEFVAALDAIYAAAFSLFCLMSHQYLLMVVVLVLCTRPATRRRQFSSMEEAADLLNQPMANMPQQEWMPACIIRYFSIAVYGIILLYSLWHDGIDWIVIVPFAVGIVCSLVEAADVYPTSGKQVRGRNSWRQFSNQRLAFETR